MASVQIETPYRLTGPDGTVAVFNDDADPNNVGMLRDVSGLDSPEVRENADELVQMDGGVHGDFYAGRRPITLTGVFLNPASAAERNEWQDTLSLASNALRGDAELRWQPDGGLERYIKVRRQQPLRITGGWQKEFHVALVAADPRIYSTTLHSTSTTLSGTVAGGFESPLTSELVSGQSVLGQVIANNTGNGETPAIIRIDGPVTNPAIQNYTTGETIYLTYTLASGEFLLLDTLNRTVLLNGSGDRYSAVDYSRSTWWFLQPGNNDIRLMASSYSTGAGLLLEWRSAWM